MNKFYRISINYNALDRIINGHKTIEGRIKKGIFINMIQGDTIEFHNKKLKCLVKIINIIDYKNILEYLSGENLDNINPNKSKEDILKIYRGFYPDILKIPKKFLAIKFKVINI